LAGNGKVAFLNTVTFKKGEETNLDSFDKVLVLRFILTRSIKRAEYF